MRFTFAIALAILLPACSQKVPEMTTDEAKRIEQITARPTTRCVGRYLIDVPEAFALNSESRGAMVEGVKIVEVKPMSKGQFGSALEQREARLQKAHMDGRPTIAVLQDVVPVPEVAGSSNGSSGQGKIFNRAESSGSAEFARVLELFAWKDGFLIHMTIGATDGTAMRLDPKVIGTPYEASERRIVSEYRAKNDRPAKLAHLLKVFQRVRGRSENEIPTEQGLCFPNGFVSGPAIEEEVVGYLFDLKDSPDVYFSFTESGNLHEETTMLQRSGEIEAEMKQGGAKTLRKGKRDIQQLPYEEWLMSGPTPDGVPGTLFNLHGNEVAEGADKPFVELDMHNGSRVVQPVDLTDKQKEERGLYKSLERATLSNAEAVAVWDKITATLRPRPGAF